MRLALVTLFVLLTSLVFPQDPAKWGVPTEADRRMTVCGYDSTANAVILYESGSIDFVSGYAYIRVYRKIKIFNPNGMEYADVRIPFFHKEAMEEIRDIRAQTINPGSGEPVVSELNRQDIFTKTVNSRWSEIRFTFPSVREGSILEYKYTMVTSRITFLDAWIFQHDIPALHSEVEIKVPEWLKYSILLFGDRLKSKYGGSENKDDRWFLDNVPGYENEKHVSCYEDYVDNLQFQLVSYETWDDGSRAGALHTVDVLNDWQTLANDVTEYYTPILNRYLAADDILKDIISPADDRETKIRKIYHYVRTSFTWNKERTIFPDKGLSGLMSSGEGNAAELNLLLCLLLYDAGIRAFPVLISTRPHGKVVLNYPLLEQFNHVIAAIEHDSVFLYADVISPNGNWRAIPYEDLNFYGYMLKGKSSRWVELKNQADSKLQKTVICKFEDSAVRMQVSGKYSGYFAQERRSAGKEQNGKAQEPLQLVTNTTLQKDSSTTAGTDDVYADYEETAWYSSGMSYGDKILINLNLDRLENPYKQKERLFPVEFDFPCSSQTRFLIVIPDGYVCKTLPKNLAVSLPGNVGKFLYNVTSSGNQLIIFIKQDINTQVLTNEYYPHLKEFYNQVVTKVNEPIILEKAL